MTLRLLVCALCLNLIVISLPSFAQTACCKTCTPDVSKPCGDSCISISRNCTKASGCACAGTTSNPSTPTTSTPIAPTQPAEPTYEQGIAAGKQICIDSPSACGIVTTSDCPITNVPAEHAIFYPDAALLTLPRVDVGNDSYTVNLSLLPNSGGALIFRVDTIRGR